MKSTYFESAISCFLAAIAAQISNPQPTPKVQSKINTLYAISVVFLILSIISNQTKQ